MTPTIGEPAPDFKLKSSLDKDISLTDYRGQKHVVLTFYPLDFSPVCSVQLPEYDGRKRDFDALDAVVLGVSRDSTYSHKAWAKELGLEVPLLADMNLVTARAYGVALEERAISTRAVFLIDKGGILRFAHVEEATGAFTLPADRVLEEVRKL